MVFWAVVLNDWGSMASRQGRNKRASSRSGVAGVSECSLVARGEVLHLHS